jgi:hypothetical protein
VSEFRAIEPQIVTATADVYKVGAWVPMSAEVMVDARGVQAAVNEAFDRLLHPWNYPDIWERRAPQENPMPWFDLFPRLTRLKARWRLAVLRHQARKRVRRMGWDELTADEHDEDWDPDFD